MRLASLVPVILLSAGCATKGSPSIQPAASVTGSYGWQRGNGAGCGLMAEELVGARLHFRLDCNRGAPSYNLAIVEDTIALAGGEAVYRTTEYGGECQLRFRFEPNAAEVVQVGSDTECGFGYGVYATGRFRRSSTSRPPFELRVESE